MLQGEPVPRSEKPNPGEDAPDSLTCDEALARLAKLERQHRVADAVLQVESLDLHSVLDRICRIAVELIPCDRATVFLYRSRARAFVSMADCGTPPHIAQRYVEKYFFGQSRAGGKRPLIPFRDDLVAGRLGYATRETATPEVRELLEDLEQYAICLVPLRSSTRGSILVSLDEPPGFDDTAFRMLEGVARQASNLIDHSRTFQKLQHAARVRAGLATLAAALNLETDPVHIARLISAEAADLFRLGVVAVLVPDRDGLVIFGSRGVSAEGLHLSLGNDTALLVEGFREGRVVFQNDLAETAMGQGPLCRELNLKAALALPLVGGDGQLGCLLLGSTELSHAFNEEIADETFVLAPITSAALERASLLQKVRRSEEHFRSLIENVSDMIAIVGPDWSFRYQSPSIERILGYGPDELIGRPIWQVIHPDDRFALGLMFQAVLDGPDGAAPRGTQEARFQRRNGAWRVLESVATRMASQDGSRVIVLNSRDVTERKRAEHDIAEARDQALAAARLKSEFVANVSHEIRTPMNGVIGMADLLVESALDETQRELVSGIRTSAEALLTLINDILDLSKIEAGKMTMEQIDFNLRALLEEVADLFAPRAFSKRLELCCALSPTVPERLVGDPHRLRQVLTNLVGNAIKFTDSGRVTLDGTVVEETVTDVRIRLTVDDTGVGIPQARQASVFDSFTQVDGSTSRRYGGTGLGLTISRQLVELMRGRIGLESRPGHGSRFWVEIRFGKQPAVENGDSDATNLAGVRVLVVDDDEVSRRVLREHLCSWGCTVEAAASGPAALDALRAAADTQPYQLVFLDLDMPDMNGGMAAEAIRAEPRTAGVPLVLLASAGERSTAAELQKRGFTATLTKPVHQSHLLSIASQVAAGRPPIGRRLIEPARRSDAPLGLRVMVAEDNPINQKVARHMLQRLGCQVTVVSDGAQAVATAEHDAYDLILMDVQMPELDGFEATALIRKREARTGGHLPILAMTAHTMGGDCERCLAAGMDGYIAKPMKTADLAAALEPYSPHPGTEPPV